MAAVAATIGAAMEVPCMVSYPPATVLYMFTPGAAMSTWSPPLGKRRLHVYAVFILFAGSAHDDDAVHNILCRYRYLAVGR